MSGAPLRDSFVLTTLPPPFSDGNNMQTFPHDNYYPAEADAVKTWLSKLSGVVRKAYEEHAGDPLIVPPVTTSTGEVLVSSSTNKLSFSKTAVLTKFPFGYTLVTCPRKDDSNHKDRYLFGHPTKHPAVNKFRSPKEFMPHLEWLATDKTRQYENCKCKLCEKRTLKGKARVRPVSASVSSGNKSAAETDEVVPGSAAAEDVISLPDCGVGGMAPDAKVEEIEDDESEPGQAPRSSRSSGVVRGGSQPSKRASASLVEATSPVSVRRGRGRPRSMTQVKSDQRSSKLVDDNEDLMQVNLSDENDELESDPVTDEVSESDDEFPRKTRNVSNTRSRAKVTRKSSRNKGNIGKAASDEGEESDSEDKGRNRTKKGRKNSMSKFVIVTSEASGDDVQDESEGPESSDKEDSDVQDQKPRRVSNRNTARGTSNKRKWEDNSVSDVEFFSRFRKNQTRSEVSYKRSRKESPPPSRFDRFKPEKRFENVPERASRLPTKGPASSPAITMIPRARRPNGPSSAPESAVNVTPLLVPPPPSPLYHEYELVWIEVFPDAPLLPDEIPAGHGVSVSLELLKDGSVFWPAIVRSICKVNGAVTENSIPKGDVVIGLNRSFYPHMKVIKDEEIPEEKNTTLNSYSPPTYVVQLLGCDIGREKEWQVKADQARLLPFRCIVPPEVINLIESYKQLKFDPELSACGIRVVELFVSALIAARDHNKKALALIGHRLIGKQIIDDGPPLSNYSLAVAQCGAAVVHVGDFVIIRQASLPGNGATDKSYRLDPPSDCHDEIFYDPGTEALVQVLSIDRDHDGDVLFRAVRCHVEDLASHPEVVDPQALHRLRIAHGVVNVYTAVRTPVVSTATARPVNASTLTDDELGAVRRLRVVDFDPEDILARFDGVFRERPTAVNVVVDPVIDVADRFVEPDGMIRVEVDG